MDYVPPTVTPTATPYHLIAAAFLLKAAHLKIVTNFVINQMTNYPNELQFFYMVKICFLRVAEESP